MQIIHSFIHALTIAGMMTWQILWSLILGFIVSAVIQAVVRKQTIAKLLGNDHPKTLAIACGLGAASSSCSYAAVAIARSLFQKGANFTAAMVFEIASTNLVIELGIIMAILLGWQFTLAEFVGGPLMIIILAIVFRLFLRKKVLEAAFLQAETGLAGSMEGHAAMDMSIGRKGSIWQRLRSAEGLTSISHIFVMEVVAVWKDIVGGLLVAGAVAAWVPTSIFRTLFFANHPLASKVWGPIIGPIISLLSFVCSIGNVPLAAVLWNSGISFGGVISFIFADLIIIPILLIYRKYYGTRMMLFIGLSFYATMVVAGWLTELIFGLGGIIPKTHHVVAIGEHITFNYTTVLNIIFIGIVGWLVVRFISTGALPMLKMMGGNPHKEKQEHCH
ncbi:MAG TPA: permease [Candidatus Dormibacteraeota bacterium]|nr:permease [Candidatus Dormibacteraeota bacterium]